MAVASNQCALTPAIRGYFFVCAAQVLIIFGLILDRGGESHGQDVLLLAGG
jgi:hypothetical protein